MSFDRSCSVHRALLHSLVQPTRSASGDAFLFVSSPHSPAIFALVVIVIVIAGFSCSTCARTIWPGAGTLARTLTCSCFAANLRMGNNNAMQCDVRRFFKLEYGNARPFFERLERENSWSKGF